MLQILKACTLHELHAIMFLTDAKLTKIFHAIKSRAHNEIIHKLLTQFLLQLWRTGCERQNNYRLSLLKLNETLIKVPKIDTPETSS